MAQITRDHRHQDEAVHHGAEHVLAPHQAAVEQRQAGTGHHEDQRGADQHPGVVARALGGFDGSLQIADASFGCGRDGLGERQRRRK